jgi:hypothetical protein
VQHELETLEEESAPGAIFAVSVTLALPLAHVAATLQSALPRCLGAKMRESDGIRHELVDLFIVATCRHVFVRKNGTEFHVEVEVFILN